VAQPWGPLLGLSEEEAAHRLREEGYNDLPITRRRGILGLALSVAQEPMLLLLVAAAAIYLVWALCARRWCSSPR
jgi:Ca2+-transporting ATPase